MRLQKKWRDAPEQWVLAKTGFYTSLITYLLFLGVEALRPGFVARYFSPHICLLAIICFGAWWSFGPPASDRRFGHWPLATLFGFFLSVIVWRLGSGFEAYRILMALLGFLVPLAVLVLIRSPKN